MPVLEIKNLKKSYGHIHALDDLNLTIEAGNIYGLLGPNGSGKTTTLGVILSILKPTSGEFRWFDGQYGDNPRKKIGAILETPNFYPYKNAQQNLEIVAHIKKAKNVDYEGILKTVNLYERRNSKFRTFSLGMKQRLAIAATLINDPEVVIFDEPTNGLDPEGIKEVRDILSNVASSGRTVIMASHILDEVEKICSHVAIIKKGKLLATGPVGSILSDDITLELSSENNSILAELLQNIPWIRVNTVDENQIDASMSAEYSMAEINRLAFEKGIVLNHLVGRKSRLEEEFLKITSTQN